MINSGLTKTIPNGVYPTMITPFTEDNKIDFGAVEKMVRWYIKNGCSGIFSVCQSSEMFFLSDDEKIELVRFIKECAAAEARSMGITEFPVLASGHVHTDIRHQADVIHRMYEAGADVIVLITNRFEDAQQQNDELWINNAENLINLLPEVPLGLYECPYPYKRFVTEEILSWCVSKERFVFFKDTCCDIDRIVNRLLVLKDSNIKLCNANGQTLLPSLRAGASGYSGVMANFHPNLYKRLMESYTKNTREAQILQSFLSIASLIELRAYPVCAKFHMNLSGIPMSLHTRSKEEAELIPLNKEEVRHLFLLEEAAKGTRF